MKIRALDVVCLFCTAFFILSGPARAQTSANTLGISSVTVEGGPIASQHFQSGDDNFHERHALAVVKVATENYGNWGLYFLSPNSVERTSVGVGYITDPYAIPLGPTQLELTGALGLVSGYQDYPVPLLAAQARLVVYHNGPWDAGVATAVTPYFMKDDTTNENEWGVVGVTPFLSIRYSFE